MAAVWNHGPMDPFEPDALYHLATTQEWESYRVAGVIEPASSLRIEL